jgi:hypothetical protein
VPLHIEGKQARKPANGTQDLRPERPANLRFESGLQRVSQIDIYARGSVCAAGCLPGIHRAQCVRTPNKMQGGCLPILSGRTLRIILDPI